MSNVKIIWHLELCIGRFLVFSVLNAKFLAFNTPDANALRA